MLDLPALVTNKYSVVYLVMTEWEPISLSELSDKIHSTETDLSDELRSFWQLIQVYPTKWVEKELGAEGGGFWVVALCGTRVIWYNDIEDGFNISPYIRWGEIEGYYCNQVELRHAIIWLFELIKFSGNTIRN